MKALDLEFKDCRLKIDWDWGKYGFEMPVLAMLDILSRNFTAQTSRDVTFEEAVKISRYPFSEKQLHQVMEIMMDKNVLLDK